MQKIFQGLLVSVLIVFSGGVPASAITSPPGFQVNTIVDELFASGETREFTYEWTPEETGTYFVSVGLFKSEWQSMTSWNHRTADITVAGNTPSALLIYGDALAHDWQDWSWGSTRNFSEALTINYTSPWGGLYLHGAANTTDKNTLAFSIMGNDASGQQIQLFMFDESGTALTPVNLNTYILGGIVSGEWKEVHIPLSDLGAANREIRGIVLQDIGGTGGNSITIDEMRLQ